MAACEKPTEILYLNPQDLRPREDQPRQFFEPVALQELADAMRAQGFISQITVRKTPKGWEVLAGHRRRQAAILAGLAEVPCVVQQLDDKQAREFVLFDNLNRADLLPWEEGAGYLEIAQTISPALIAQKIGKSLDYVQGRIALADLCESARKAYLAKEFDLPSLREVASLPNTPVGVRYCPSCGEAAPEADPSCAACGHALREEQVVVADNPQEAAVRLCRGKTLRQVQAGVEYLRGQYGLKASKQAAMDFGILTEKPEALAVRSKIEAALGSISRLGEDVLRHPEAVTHLRREQRETVSAQAAFCINILCQVQRFCQETS